MEGFGGLTIVTNALKTALKLGEYENLKVYCTGGRLRDNSVSLVGIQAVNFLSACNADIAFFSCRGFSFEKGVTEASEDEAEIKRQMVRSSKIRVLLCDSSKLNTVFFSSICPVSDLDIIISDAQFSELETARLGSLGIRLIHAGQA